MASIVGTAHSIAGGTCKVTSVCDLHDGKTAVLLMIEAKSAVIGTAIYGRCVETQGRFGRFVIITDVFIICYIGGDQHFKRTVMRTML